VTDIVLEGLLAKTRGAIGRYPDAGDRYLFPFENVVPVPVHMVGVTKPLMVEWWAEGTLVERRELPAWTGSHTALADLVIEKPCKSQR
jgi:hypothetical protein